MNKHVDSFLIKTAPDTPYGKKLRRAASEILNLERKYQISRFSIDQEIKKQIDAVIKEKLEESE